MRIKHFFFIPLLLCLVSFVAHKFYVSNNIIEYNARTGIYEVTMKIFTDDLEKACSPNGGSMFLGSEMEIQNADYLIETYLMKNFKVKLNDQPVLMTYIGKEIDPELSLIYFEFRFADAPSSISITNTVLFEHFHDQKNIMDIRMNGWNRTVFLTKERNSETVFR